MVPSPTSEHYLESGLGLVTPPTPGSLGGAGNVRRSLGGAAGGGGGGMMVAGQQQPVRLALTHLYEVDREEEVDPS